MADNNHVDDILRDIERQKASDDITAQHAEDFMPGATPIQQAQGRRAELVKDFSLDLDVDSLVPDAVIETNVTQSDELTEITEDNKTKTEKPHPPRHKNKRLGRVLYSLMVIVLSVGIALTGIGYFFEASGINGDDTIIDVEIPRGAYTAQIASILKDKGLINSTLSFRLYAKIAKADGMWQSGMFMLSSNMGYTGIVDELQASKPRANVNVTIPEGFTVEEIANLLEEKEVCTKEDFFSAIVNGDYDYDFIKAIPTAADGQEYAGRIYRLEGYLFPDTYNFYIGSSGEMVINRMLANFNEKLTSDIRKQISDMGWTIDKAITFASVIQGEAGKPEDMYAVSKVLTNRMQPNSGFAKLQCDATRDYIRGILPSVSGAAVTTSSYDTYVREGLPVGAINNPGLMAIDAALHPSTDAEYATCYYFATDYDTGITYYSKTLAQHEATCRRYKIGMYG